MDEDFEEYTDGTTNWFESGSASNKWIAPADATAITVDDFHNKSINSGTTKGRLVRANIGISNGTVKISGEQRPADSASSRALRVCFSRSGEN